MSASKMTAILIELCKDEAEKYTAQATSNWLNTSLFIFKGIWFILVFIMIVAADLFVVDVVISNSIFSAIIINFNTLHKTSWLRSFPSQYFLKILWTVIIWVLGRESCHSDSYRSCLSFLLSAIINVLWLAIIIYHY